MNINEFKECYKSLTLTQEEFYKSEALTDKELTEIRTYIKALQSKGATSKIIIKHLQNFNKKISETWKAERVYYTEIKRADTKIVANAGKELEISTYKAVLSPNACQMCRKTLQGKILKSNQIVKNGNPIVPLHPNCYCVLLPID
jgi:SPP1 gp7 family putative phage head morphogenesis protein